MNSLFPLLASLVAFAPMVVTGAVYNFDENQQIDDFRFNHAVEKGGNAWKWEREAGRQGGGGLLASNEGGVSVLTLTKALDNATPKVLSIAFKWGKPVLGLGHGLFVGLAPEEDYLPLVTSEPVDARHSQLYFGIGRLSDSNTVRIIGNSASAETVFNFQAPESSYVDLIPGAWYQLSGRVSYLGHERKYEIAVTLSSINGEGELEEISTYTFKTLELSRLAQKEKVHAYFGSSHGAVNRGTVAVDDFSVTLDP